MGKREFGNRENMCAFNNATIVGLHDSDLLTKTRLSALFDGLLLRTV